MERDMLNNSNIKAYIVEWVMWGYLFRINKIFSTIGYDQDTTKINNLRKTYRKYSKYFLNNIDYIMSVTFYNLCINANK